MILKILIIILFLGLVISLFTGFGFLMTDKGNNNSRRTWNALTIRVTLTVLLLITIIYAVTTGQLHSQAPWGLSQEPVAAEQQ